MRQPKERDRVIERLVCVCVHVCVGVGVYVCMCVRACVCVSVYKCKRRDVATNVNTKALVNSFFGPRC